MKTKSIFLIGCSGVLLILVLSFLVGYLIGMKPGTPKLSSGSWLIIDPSGAVTDYNEIRNQGFFSFINPSADDICRRIRHSAKDNKIKGILIRPGLAQISYANLSEINAALDDFKKSKKPVYAHGEVMTQKDYLFCAMADKIYMDPAASGGLILEGVSANVLFYKEALAKLGVKMHVMQAGEFKGAGEPYTQTSLSPGTEANLRKVLKARYDLLQKHIGKLRHLDSTRVNDVYENRPDLFINASVAKQYGLIDEIASWDELLAKLGIAEEEKYVSLKDYASPTPKILPGSKVAVINLSGNIAAGQAYSFGPETSISAAKVENILEQIAEDDVKAIVLRVNSPGGSALESELIYQKLKRLDIPIVVSMGGVAASGGYYISCAGDYIFADPYTITGSIGVIMALPEAVELGNKLGVDSQTLSYGKFAGSTSIFEKYDQELLNSLKRNSENVYTEFKQRVMDARKISPQDIAAVAEGRVFSAEDAKAMHLIDDVGGLNAAVAKAAALAKLTSYEVAQYPKQISFFDLLSNGDLFRMTAQFIKTCNTSLEERAQNYLQRTLATKQWLYFFPFSVD